MTIFWRIFFSFFMISHYLVIVLFWSFLDLVVWFSETF